METPIKTTTQDIDADYVKSAENVSGGDPDALSADKLLKQLDSIHQIPTLPAVASRVNQMLQDINTPAQELAKIIEKDQAIVPKLLKLVNSAFYGFNSKISSVAHAIMLLGYNTVRNAVVSVAIFDVLKIQSKFHGFDITQFWRHAIAVATICRFLDKETGNRQKENSFTAGLIHDIGKVIMANYYEDRFAAVLQTMQTEKMRFYKAECSLFPLRHDAIGAYLALRWNLPNIFRKTIAFHHQPEKIPTDNELILIVHVADALANDYLGPMPFKEKTPICLSAGNMMKPQIHTVRKWMPEIKNEVQNACDLLFER